MIDAGFDYTGHGITSRELYDEELVKVEYDQRYTTSNSPRNGSSCRVGKYLALHDGYRSYVSFYYV